MMSAISDLRKKKYSRGKSRGFMSPKNTR